MFSLHTLASPNGRNVNYYEKNLPGGKKLSCFIYLYRFRKHVSYGFPTINFCNKEYVMPMMLIHWEEAYIL